MLIFTRFIPRTVHLSSTLCELGNNTVLRSLYTSQKQYDRFSLPLPLRSQGRKLSVNYTELNKLLSLDTIKLIDVRTPKELTRDGKIPGSVNIPLDRLSYALNLQDEQFKETFGFARPQKEADLVFHCLGGVRSGKALAIALVLGYSNSQHYAGGWEDYSIQRLQVDYKAATVDYDQLNTLLSQKTITLIDVRDPDELLRDGTIPRAFNLPLGAMYLALKLDAAQFGVKFGFPRPNEEDDVVFHCCGKCGIRSRKALGLALALGYNKSRHYPGGTEEWISKKLQI